MFFCLQWAMHSWFIWNKSGIFIRPPSPSNDSALVLHIHPLKWHRTQCGFSRPTACHGPGARSTQRKPCTVGRSCQSHHGGHYLLPSRSLSTGLARALWREWKLMRPCVLPQGGLFRSLSEPIDHTCFEEHL